MSVAFRAKKLLASALAALSIVSAESLKGQSGSYGNYNGFDWYSDGLAVEITGYDGPGGVVVIPSRITSLPVISIGYEAFFGDSSLASVTIPDGVTIIGDYAFFGDSGLASVTIPSSVTTIGVDAFGGCTNLANVTIPDSVTYIGDGAFDAGTRLTAITVDSGNLSYCSVNGVLFDKSRTTLLQYPGGLSGSYQIPSSVTTIGTDAFGGCIGLTNVTIPDTDYTQVVVAFRGTAFPLSNPFANLKADAGFVNGNPGTLLINYAYAAATFIQGVYQNNPNANITVTGHSLGGGLAQLIGKRTGLAAYGFNAPGSAGAYSLLKQDLDDGLAYGPNPWGSGPLGNGPNISYRIDTDQVSLAGTNFPSVFTIASANPLPAFTAPYLPQFLLNVGIFLNNHSIDTVYNQIVMHAAVTAGIPIDNQNVLQDLGNLADWYSTSYATAIQNASSAYSFAFNATDTSGTVINPVPSDTGQPSGGTDFKFTEDAGSPGVTGCILPVINGVSSYEIRYGSGGTTSTFQSVQPGSLFPFDPVNEFEFMALDSNGNPVVPTNLVIGLFFASTGSVTGTLTQSFIAPTSPELQIVLIGNQVNLTWSTNVVSGIQLVSATTLEAPVSWNAVTNTPVVVSNQYLVTVPVANRAGFFQLRQ